PLPLSNGSAGLTRPGLPALGTDSLGGSVAVRFPPARPAGWTGNTFHIIMKVDAGDQIAEANENNNFGQMGEGIDQHVVTIPDPPELHSTALSTVTPTRTWGQAIAISSTIQNTGGPTSGFYTSWYLSPDPVGSADDIPLPIGSPTGGTTAYAINLQPMATGTFTPTLYLPAARPAGWTGTTFYLITKTDSLNQVAESNEDNNFGQLGLGVDKIALTIT
ncbi:MAG TPA: CARDB domain-containing protein, partial [Gemmataceae bacterium]|nr:CARDB domain-containing protein [Gemmataceae bacterium]